MTPTPTAAARVSGTIKALEWHDNAEFGRQPMSYAETEFGPWLVVAYSGRDGRWTPCDPRGNDSDDDWATADEAKAAAQADYEARILAAIQPEPEPVSQAALQPDQNISPICQPEPQPVAKVGELATIIGMLARHVPDDKQIKGKALDYLRRHGLQGSPLRDDATPSSAGTVSVEAAALESIAGEMHETYREMLIGKMPTELEVNAWEAALRALAGEGGR